MQFTTARNEQKLVSEAVVDRPLKGIISDLIHFSPFFLW
jgi:hypothetical protein